MCPGKFICLDSSEYRSRINANTYDLETPLKYISGTLCRINAISMKLNENRMIQNENTIYHIIQS